MFGTGARVFGTLALAAAVTAVPARAAAQGVEFGLGAGATVPVGDASDFLNTGWHILASASIVPDNSVIGFQVDGMYTRMAQEDLGFGDDLTTQIINGTANIVFKFKVAEEAKFRPFLIGGVGIYNYKTVGEGDVENLEDGATDFGVNAGAGFDVKLGGAGLFVAGRFHNIFVGGDLDEGADIKLIPITIGIRFGGT